MKRIAADTHVHLYSCYRMEDAFRCAWTNLDKLAGTGGDRALLLFLTERSDNHFFRSAMEGKMPMGDGWQTQDVGDENAFCVHREDDKACLCVLNGRQIVTKERLEVLALTADPHVSDGMEAGKVIEATLSVGAVPVLPWAPGKWLFERGRVVAELLRAFQPGQLLIGDTTLRPVGCGEPQLMREARERGFRIVAGTDPLPFDGEELGIGRYGITWNGDLGEYSLVRDIKTMLLDSQCEMRVAGRRDGVLSVLRRLIRNRRASRQRLDIQGSSHKSQVSRET